MLNLILLGPPGAGKGTQALAIAGSLGLHRLSTGDLLRRHIRRESQLGAQARVYYDKGEYVPDCLVVAMVKEEITSFLPENGMVLDGFPRTVAQAKALERMLTEIGKRIDTVIEIDSDTEEIVRRAEGRRVCPEGHTYHMVKNPPRSGGRCDVDGLPLQQRVDDQPDTVRKRITVYHERTKPLLTYYAAKGLIQRVDGTQSIEEVTESIQHVLSNVGVR